MSHLKERKEKICLNCNAELHGRFCHICGQENLEPKETVWHLVNHFFQDITHFDGKFFTTVKDLLTKPGFLSKEYMLGRRASYLNPIRMYVFTSAFFFLIFFSLTNIKRAINNSEPNKVEAKENVKDWENQLAELKNEIKKGDEDSVETSEDIKNLEEKIIAVKKEYGDTSTKRFSKDEIAMLLLKSRQDSSIYKYIPKNVKDQLKNDMDKDIKKDSVKKPKVYVNILKSRYKSLEAYDSAQKALAPENRDGWFKSIYEKRLIALNIEYNEDSRGFREHFFENFLHSFPKILFISLPFFALFLKLVYFRSKQFYYTSHGIFSIHVFCATFILLLFLMLSSWLQTEITWNWVDVVLSIFDFCVWLYLFIYLYKAMRKFYGQGRFKTFVKYIIVCSFAFILNIVLLAFFVLISAISI